MATTDFDLLKELESEFEEEGLESEFLPAGPELQYLVSFSTMGFETTHKFRHNFWLINRGFLKKGRLWTSSLFRDDFCKASHYVINIPGMGVKRFAVIWGFPVEYQTRTGKQPRLIDIGRWGGTFVSTLEKKGRLVRRPYRPCGLPRHSVGRGLLIYGRSKLFPQTQR